MKPHRKTQREDLGVGVPEDQTSRENRKGLEQLEGPDVVSYIHKRT